MQDLLGGVTTNFRRLVVITVELVVALLEDALGPTSGGPMTGRSEVMSTQLGGALTREAGRKMKATHGATLLPVTRGQGGVLRWPAFLTTQVQAGKTTRDGLEATI